MDRLRITPAPVRASPFCVGIPPSAPVTVVAVGNSGDTPYIGHVGASPYRVGSPYRIGTPRAISMVWRPICATPSFRLGRMEGHWLPDCPPFTGHRMSAGGATAV